MLTKDQILDNRYRIEGPLKKGGFGMIYKAWDERLEIYCAVKQNQLEGDDASKQFTREAKILAQLKHPNIVTVRDHFISPGLGQFLVMDFVDGSDLDELPEKEGHPFSQAQALKWISQICDALDYLHTHQPPVIHRDIKPSNIRITSYDNAILVDFGLSKLGEEGQSTSIGARGYSAGYAPPEQYGMGRTGPSSDIYSLGATLYTLLTCQRPPDVWAILIGDLQPPRPIHELNTVVTKALSDTVTQAMKIKPHERFQSATEFKTALITNIPAERTVDRVKSVIAPAPTVIESNTINEKQQKVSQLDKPSSLLDWSKIGVSYKTEFHVDFDWWRRNGQNYRGGESEFERDLKSLLCPEHKDAAKGLGIGQIDPATKERTYQFNVRHVVITHCAKRPNFISDAGDLIPEKVFRLFLQNENLPMSAEEIGSRLSIHPEGILQSLIRDFGTNHKYGPYKGIRPYSPVDLLEAGEIRTGMLASISPSQILVSIGAKSEGVVSGRELDQLSAEEREALQVGQEVHVFVVNPEDENGNVVLSLKRAQEQISWENVEKLVQSDTVIDSKVIGFNEGGLIVGVEALRGFVPSSQISALRRSQSTGDTPERRWQKMIGQPISVRVIEVDRERRRLILSERAASTESRQSIKERVIDELEEGKVYTGRVTSLANFGAFININGADGLVHLSELSWEHIDHPREVLEVGQEVKVKVINVDREKKRIGLSVRALQSDPWQTCVEKYKYSVGQLVEGVITHLTKFGAFARLEGDIEGLIHISEIADHRIEHPKEVLKEGEVKSLRVIRIDPDQHRIGLSLRKVDSATFADKDFKMLTAQFNAEDDDK
jgi:small subunit ribosomal protein S1